MACFQPHLYSRTIAFAQQFAAALSLADAVVLLDIFGAREEPVEGVDSRIIIDHMEREAAATTVYEPNFSYAPSTIAGITQAGDLVLTMGAGTVTLLGDDILATLGEG